MKKVGQYVAGSVATLTMIPEMSAPTVAIQPIQVIRKLVSQSPSSSGNCGNYWEETYRTD